MLPLFTTTNEKMQTLTVTTQEKKDGIIQDVTHHVYPFIFTPESTLLLYEKAKQFPVIFGRRLESLEDFTAFFIRQNLQDYIEPSGLVWGIGNEEEPLRGIFYLTDITDIEASVHYAFFDRRQNGREPLVRKMLQHVFSRYGFVRLNAYIPAYAGFAVRAFAERSGFRIEGRKRKASWWKGKWFDTYLFGILPEDLTDGRTD